MSVADRIQYCYTRMRWKNQTKYDIFLLTLWQQMFIHNYMQRGIKKIHLVGGGGQ